MPISDPDKIIFIHIPKTGGTSIENVLGMHGGKNDIGIYPYLDQKKNHKILFGKGLQHLTAKSIKHRIGGQKFFSYYKFSIVRNPYDRIVSYAAWIKENKNNPLSRSEFEGFLKKTSISLEYKFNIMLRPQYKFIYIKNKLVVNQLLRFERFEEGVSILEKQVKRSLHLEFRMPSNHEEFAYYYNKKSSSLIRRIYQKDFEYFGYDL